MKSNRCHNIPGLFTSTGISYSWNPLFSDPPISPNGIKFIPLVTTDDLYSEAETMQHCIGCYGPVCANDGHHILSLRTIYGITLSTLEVGPLKGNYIEVLQHRGFRNSCPPPAALIALQWLIQQLSNRLIAIDVATITKKLSISRIARRSRTESLLTGLKRAHLVWNRHLSKPWNNSIFDNFVKLLFDRIVACIEEIAPEEGAISIAIEQTNFSLPAGYVVEPIICIDDIRYLSRTDFRIVVEAVGIDVFAIALKNAPDELRDWVYHNVFDDLLENIIMRSAVIGPVMRKTIDEAQSSVVEIMSSLDAEGRIDLSTQIRQLP